MCENMICLGQDRLQGDVIIYTTLLGGLRMCGSVVSLLERL